MQLGFQILGIGRIAAQVAPAVQGQARFFDRLAESVIAVGGQVGQVGAFRPHEQDFAVPEPEKVGGSLVGPLEIVREYRMETVLEAPVHDEDHGDPARLKQCEKLLVSVVEGEYRGAALLQDAAGNALCVQSRMNGNQHHVVSALGEAGFDFGDDRTDEVPDEGPARVDAEQDAVSHEEVFCARESNQSGAMTNASRLSFTCAQCA